MSGAAWDPKELEQIADVDELHISGRRRDGSLHKPVTIWFVVLNGTVFVRSVNGRDGAWHRGTQVMHEGQISVGALTKDVTFTNVDSDVPLNQSIDEAYRAKYGKWPEPTETVLTEKARASTLRVDPR